jgi:Flp pilus assembly pilin Flp
MRHLLGSFFGDEEGQDFVEYSLLLAFVALASAAIFIVSTNSINTVWGVTENSLSAAKAKAAS